VKLGTEDRKKVVFLAILAAVAGYMVYANLLSSPGPGGAPPPAPASAVPAGDVPRDVALTARRAPVARKQGDEFHPVLHSKRPEEQIDPMSIDPTLRLDLLAKLQEVEPVGGARNLFQFGAPPVKEALKGPEPVVTPKPPTAVRADNEPPKDSGPPPPPPINLKYYGYSARNNGKKTAFFLDGEDILIAAEGETVKRRYRVVRIGVNSVLMEDTESKRQQSLPLAEEAAQNASAE
jgi:hypothetical protein